ncbi:MAG: hypothetical protein CFE25_02665 [Chitinophagaceae bacterium BSSC1]|nr:MAG: hypothetical protein CFE25_02665 [Chitinophagaceae bacterium BSSC1]
MVYFIPFLLLTVIVEFVGYLAVTYGIKNRNYWIYNIFNLIEFLFYAYLFASNFQLKFLRLLAYASMPVLILFSSLNYIYIQGSENFHTYTLLLGSFFMVFFCCCFFYEWVLPEQITQNLIRQPFFWICVGLLLFYLGSVIINALFEYLRSSDMIQEGKRIYVFINRSLNIILYTSFSISFLICRKNRKESLSQL